MLCTDTCIPERQYESADVDYRRFTYLKLSITLDCNFKTFFKSEEEKFTIFFSTSRFPGILCQISKNHPKQLFIISVNAEDNKKFQCYACVKFFQMNNFNAHKQFRASLTYFCKNFFENLLKPKRMQVFPLNLQYQNEMSDFYEKKRVKAYEVHLMSKSNMRFTL